MSRSLMRVLDLWINHPGRSFLTSNTTDLDQIASSWHSDSDSSALLTLHLAKEENNWRSAAAVVEMPSLEIGARSDESTQL